MLKQAIRQSLLPAINHIVHNNLSDDDYTKLTERFSIYVNGGDKADLEQKVLSWWNKSGKRTLEIKPKAIQHVCLRFNRSQFQIDKKGQLKMLGDAAISFFVRYRVEGHKHPSYEKIADLSRWNQLEEVISERLAGIKSQHIGVFPTLKEYLPVYKHLLILANPKTAQNKITIIKRHFNHLMTTPINLIDSNALEKWLISHSVKRTKMQINSGVSRFDLKEQTIKGALCTLRAALSKAAEKYRFEPDKRLYSDLFKIHVHNTNNNYFSEEEVEQIVHSLAERDRTLLTKRTSVIHKEVLFADYLTPFVLLCIHTGLRPSHALRIRLTDIDWDSRQVLIRGTDGKIQKDKHTPITGEVMELLQQWISQRAKKSTWLFPHPSNPTDHLQDYSCRLTTWKKSLPFRFDFLIARHTFGTLITKYFKNIQVTSNLMHHKDIKLTRDRYSHHIESDGQQASQLLSKHLPTFSSLAKEQGAAALMQ